MNWVRYNNTRKLELDFRRKHIEIKAFAFTQFSLFMMLYFFFFKFMLVGITVCKKRLYNRILKGWP